MKKLRKALFLGLALCLLGAVPATASAGILHSGASDVAVGTQISGKGVSGNTQFYSGGSVYFECTGASMTGTVAANRAESAESSVESLRLTGPQTEERCGTASGSVKITLETPACLRYGTSPSEWFIRGKACLTNAGVPHLIMVHSFGATCNYRGSGTGSLAFTSNINSEPLVLHQTSAGASFTAEPGSSFLCPAALTLKNLNLELQTASGQGLKVLS